MQPVQSCPRCASWWQVPAEPGNNLGGGYEDVRIVRRYFGRLDYADKICIGEVEWSLDSAVPMFG